MYLKVFRMCIQTLLLDCFPTVPLSVGCILVLCAQLKLIILELYECSCIINGYKKKKIYIILVFEK